MSIKKILILLVIIAIIAIVVNEFMNYQFYSSRIDKILRAYLDRD